MYTILVNLDNTLKTTVYTHIMERSKLVDQLHFLVPQTYGEYDMNDFEVTLEYVLPVSRIYKTITLEAEMDLYKDTYLEYKLPLDTYLTSEPGDVELQLTFSASSGNTIYVRKTEKTTIKVNPITNWSNLIADDALTALDKRITQLQANAEILSATAAAYEAAKADNIKLVKDEDTSKSSLYLTSNGTKIGNEISIGDLGNVIADDTSDGMVTMII